MHEHKRYNFILTIVCLILLMNSAEDLRITAKPVIADDRLF